MWKILSKLTEYNATLSIIRRMGSFAYKED